MKNAKKGEEKRRGRENRGITKEYEMNKRGDDRRKIKKEGGLKGVNVTKYYLWLLHLYRRSEMERHGNENEESENKRK